jgi:uncharacterized membrane protein (UPF0182 family)
MTRRARWIQAGVIGLLVALLAGRWLADQAANRLWAEALGVAGTHAGIARLRLVLWIGAFLVATGWCVGHMYVFYRSIGSVHVPRRLGNVEFVEAVPRPYLLAGAIGIGLVLAFGIANGAGDWWYAARLLSERSDLGVVDPILNRDAGYYLFALPWYRITHEFVTVLAGVMLAVVLLLYAGVGAVRWQRRRLVVNDLARFHLAALFAAFAGTLFWGYRLEPAEYVAGIHGIPIDAVLTQVRIPVARMLSVIALLAVVASLAWLWAPNVAVVVGAWALLGAASLMGRYVLPPFSSAVRSPQRLAVANLDDAVAGLEGLAFGLVAADRRLAPPEEQSPRALAGHAARLVTAPIWDDFAVTGALNALARGEPYYRLWDAALDLYRTPGGRALPVYLAVREVDLNAPRETGERISWERLHTLPYGHASGVLAVAADRVRDDGSPVFIPDLAHADSGAKGVTETLLDEPDVFFSPTATEFAIVAADSGRFAGVRAGGSLRRLALAWALQSPRLATSSLIDPRVLVLWDRAVGARLARYAPFASFERAYPVVARGRLYWLAAGYVAAQGFPMVRSVRWRNDDVRYLRAGFLGMVEARSGRTSLYLLPDPDPLSAAWARLAPEIVGAADQIPAEVAPHLRYPADLFRAQLALLRSRTAATGSTIGAPPGPPPEARETLAPPAGATRAPRETPPPGAWWTGPWIADTTTRLRLLATLEGAGSEAVSGVMQGTVVDRKPVLDVVRLSPAVELATAAEISQRLASTHAPVIGVTGPRRTVPFTDGVLTTQTAYATGPGGHRLVDVVVQWGSIVARGTTLPSAMGAAMVARGRASEGTAGWLEARRWFDRLDQARSRGDWAAFGRAYDELRRLLGGPARAP